MVPIFRAAKYQNDEKNEKIKRVIMGKKIRTTSNAEHKGTKTFLEDEAFNSKQEKIGTYSKVHEVGDSNSLEFNLTSKRKK